MIHETARPGPSKPIKKHDKHSKTSLLHRSAKVSPSPLAAVTSHESIMLKGCPGPSELLSGNMTATPTFQQL
jgi:hypothetical protein